MDDIAQTAHLPSHTEFTHFGTDNSRSETNEHANRIAHGEFLARAEGPHDP
jgi:hypothetical protein